MRLLKRRVNKFRSTNDTMKVIEVKVCVMENA